MQAGKDFFKEGIKAETLIRGDLKANEVGVIIV